MPVVHESEALTEDDVQNTTNKLLETNQKLATLTLSNSKLSADKPQPKWLALDRKVLRFFCYFKEGVHESNLENYRVRKCVLYYYLEDDTVHVSEPKQDNSGIPQGSLLKRHRVPKPNTTQYYTLSDFNVGQNVEIYGKVMRIVDCDAYTRDIMGQMGIQVPSGEEYPADPYSIVRDEEKKNMNPLNILGHEDTHLKRFLEYSFKGRHTAPSKDEKVAIQQFLSKDRQVLRFYCCWDDREVLYGDFRYFVLEYFLADDKFKISEEYDSNCGRDPFPLFVKKMQIMKPETNQPYTHKDLMIGKTIVIFSKKFLMYDCDDFTKQFYKEKYGVTDFDPLVVALKKAAPVKIEPPPYNGYGTEEDSLGSWKHLVLKPPKKDLKKYMEHDKHTLRFSAMMDTTKPEDVDRKFIISFYMSDDTLAIFEPAQRNSGIMGGKFLQRQRVKNTATGAYFKSSDLYVGATVQINIHKFVLQQTDEASVKLMEKHL